MYVATHFLIGNMSRPKHTSIALSIVTYPLSPTILIVECYFVRGYQTVIPFIFRSRISSAISPFQTMRECFGGGGGGGGTEQCVESLFVRFNY